MQRIALAIKERSMEATRLARDLLVWLGRRGHTVVLDEVAARILQMERASSADLAGADLVVVLGGDGTLLSVARQVCGQAPILGVNLGSLGFLTELHREELYPALIQVLEGEYELDERSLLAVRLRRAGGQSQEYRAFNDVVLTKSALARIVQLRVEVEERVVAVYRADGLIVSTPTGSTAYNLSAGGPIVYPQLRVAVLTPICPHTLTMRPLVVPDASTIRVTLETPREEVYLTLDGQEGTTFGFRDSIEIQTAPDSVRLVRVTGRTFYDGLRSKLRWGE